MKKSVFTLMIAGAVFIGYLSGCKRNELASIDSIQTVNEEDTLIVAGEEIDVSCTAVDVEEDSLLYKWEASGGQILEGQENPQVTWKSPDSSGTYVLICSVTDDETWDTLRIVTDSIQIDVQNYFPMVQGNWWYYDGFFKFAIDIPVELEASVYSREDLGANEVRWHIHRLYRWESDSTTENDDMFYKVIGDSIWQSYSDSNNLILIQPVRENKTWDYNSDVTAEVVEIKDRGTEAFSFQDCVHVEYVHKTDTTKEKRDLWFAPDVGIIHDEWLQFLFGHEFELIDYELKEE